MEDITLSGFGDLLKAYRKQRKISQQALASFLRCSSQHNWRVGTRRLSPRKQNYGAGNGKTITPER